MVERRCNWGEDRIFYRDPDGYLLSLPARWTSVEAEDPFVVVGAGRSRFRAVDLIDLAALVLKLRLGTQGNGVSGELRRICKGDYVAVFGGRVRGVGRVRVVSHQ